MKDAEMDHILSRQDEIVPSSGFTASVMEAVRREATAPAPIPFPWKRALPAMVVAAAVVSCVVALFVTAILEVGRGSATAYSTPAHLPSLLPVSQSGIVTWTALSLLMSFVSVKISLRLAGSRT